MDSAQSNGELEFDLKGRSTLDDTRITITTVITYCKGVSTVTADANRRITQALLVG